MDIIRVFCPPVGLPYTARGCTAGSLTSTHHTNMVQLRLPVECWSAKLFRKIPSFRPTRRPNASPYRLCCVCVEATQNPALVNRVRPAEALAPARADFSPEAVSSLPRWSWCSTTAAWLRVLLLGSLKTGDTQNFYPLLKQHFVTSICSQRQHRATEKTTTLGQIHLPTQHH